MLELKQGCTQSKWVMLDRNTLNCCNKLLKGFSYCTNPVNINFFSGNLSLQNPVKNIIMMKSRKQHM